MGSCPKYLPLLSPHPQEEEERKAREEQARWEHEEYLKLKEAFVVEEEGVSETMTEEQVGPSPRETCVTGIVCVKSKAILAVCRESDRVPLNVDPWSPQGTLSCHPLVWEALPVMKAGGGVGTQDSLQASSMRVSQECS